MNYFKKIRKVLEFVWNNEYSSFYRDKYTKAGINPLKDINSLEDFKKLPYLTKEEIVNSDPFDRFYMPWNEFGTVGISSGTTNATNSLSVVFRNHGQTDFVTTKKEQKASRRGIRSIMQLLPSPQASKNLIENYILARKNNRRFINIMGDIKNLSLSAKIAAKVKTDSIITSPTTLYFFLPYLKKEYDLSNFKKIILIGEYCSGQKARLFKKLFKNAAFFYGYGLSEAQGGAVGMYCRYLDPMTNNIFHPSLNYYHEVINGELIITNFYKNGFPLIRYKTGDAVEVAGCKCECGSSKQLKVLGRINYDAIKAHGAFIYAHLVEKALLPFFKYLASPDFQLHIFEDIVGEKIIPRFKLQLVLKRSCQSKEASIKEQIAQGISESWFLSAKKTLANLVSEGFFRPLEIEFLEAFPVTGKHKRIVSHIN